MKVLYIFPQFSAKNSGGSVVCKRNYDSLCAYYGEDAIISYPIHRKGKKNTIEMFLDDLFSMGFGGLTVEDKKHIVLLIKKEGVGLVFIDSSLFGGLTQYIKKRVTVKTIVFFHNVEYDFGIVLYRKKLSLSYRILFAYLNEKKAIQNSDIIITLTNKDKDRLYSLYRRAADYVMPVAIKNHDLASDYSINYSQPPCILFFGSNFPPNVEAAKIIINDILPNIKAKVIIAGSGMEKLQETFSQSDSLKISGFVDDISKLYNTADFVIMPIFSGAGMKVKTAEALGYGKNIIATSNALEGYEVDDIPGVIRCDSIPEFIVAINNFEYSIPRFNKKARELFLAKYSYSASLRSFKEIYEQL